MEWIDRKVGKDQVSDRGRWLGWECIKGSDRLRLFFTVLARFLTSWTPPYLSAMFQASAEVPCT